MRNKKLNLWTLGGLSFLELVRRTARECWRDEVFGQGGRMAFYHFLAIFPCLLVLFTIGAHVPHVADHMKIALQDLASRVLPHQASQLFQGIMEELNRHTHEGARFITICAGGLWAALNGTWAMIYGINTAYEVEESRSWRVLAVTIAGLTFFLVLVGSFAVFLIVCSAYLQARFHGGAVALVILEWMVLGGSLLFTFAVLYRFAPNLHDCEWRWSTPGALCGVILWIGSTFATRLYFEHVNNYYRSYGHLNGVVMLLLWLYISNGAILIGGEMNSEIEKNLEEGGLPDPVAHRDRSRSGDGRVNTKRTG